MTIASPLLPRRPDAVALFTAHGAITVGQINELAATLIKRITASLPVCSGDNHGNRPCVVLPSSDPVAYMAGLIACVSTGIAVVPWRDTSLALEAVLDAVRPDAIVRFGTSAANCHLEPADHPLETSRRGEIILMTSGSTGEPKGVALDFAQVLLNCLSAGSVLKVWECAGWAIDIDMALTSATCHMLMAWQFDLPFIHLGAHGDEAFGKVFANGDVGFGGSPVQLLRLVEQLRGEQRPRTLVSSGDFLTPPMIEQLIARFPNARINKLYGLTELGGRFCCMPHDLLIDDMAAAGRALPGFAARLVEGTAHGAIGEIEARTPLMTAGYYLPGGTFLPIDRDWFATGDIGRIDAAGTVTLVGRADDVFKVGGEKVDRQTIETALTGILAAHEYCVLGVEHRLLGQCPALFIANSNGTPTPLWHEIVGHLRQVELPTRFFPSLMYRVDGNLPRLANGKIDRSNLKQNHALLPRLS